MADKNNSELFGWLTGQWNKQLDDKKDDRNKKPVKGRKSDDGLHWIDELEMYDAIFEDE